MSLFYRLPSAAARIVLLALLVAVTAWVPAMAADIHVSSTNGDDAFDGSTFAVLGGGVGPKQTIEAALAMAAPGDVLILEAGTYVPVGGKLTLDKAVSIQVQALSSTTVATLAGDLAIAADVTISTGANAFAIASGGNLDLESGRLTVITPGDLLLPSGVTITRVAGSIVGNTPAFGADTYLVYNDDRSGTVTTAGLEVPADLGAGTITIDQASGTMEFPNPMVATGITIAPGTTVATTFYSSVTSHGDARRSEDARGDLIFTDLELGPNNLVNAERTGTLSVLGTLSFTANKNDEVAKPAINNTAGGTLTLGNVVFAGVAAPSPGTDQMRLLVNGVGGVITVRETITSQAAPSTSEGTDQVHDVDVAIFQNRGSVVVRGDATVEHVYNTHANASVAFYGATTLNQAVAPGLAPGSINNTLGSVAFYGPATIWGDVVNAAGQTISFEANGTLAGDVTNAGTITLGPSLQLDLQSDADFTRIGTINGANASVLVSGDGALGEAAVQGALSVSGDGNMASAVTVGGDMTVSGSGDFTAPVAVTGALTLSGSNDFLPGSAGSDIRGVLTVNGTTVIAVGNATDRIVSTGGVAIGSTGALTVSAGNTLLVRGGFDDSQGGAFTANGTDAMLHFVLDDDYDWTPGVNRRMDLLRIGGGSGHKLTMRQSVDVIQRVVVDAGTVLDVTDKLVRVSEDDGVAEIMGTVLASQATGALSFKANDQSLTGGGTVTNLVVNNPADVPVPVRLDSAVRVTNKIQLFDGGVDLNGKVMTLGPAPALLERNLAGTATSIVDTAGGGSIVGSYSLLYSGALTADTAVGREFSNGALVDLTVLATGGAVVVSDPGSWTASPAIDLSGDLTVADDAELRLVSSRVVRAAGTLTVAARGRISGTDSMVLTGDEKAHTVAGLVDASGGIGLAGAGATMAGAASDGTAAHLDRAEISALSVTGSGVVVDGLQAIRGGVSVSSGASLSLGLLPSTGQDTDNQTIGGDLVVEGTGFTMLSDLSLTGQNAPGSVLHTAGVFDFGGFDLVMETPGAVFANMAGGSLSYTTSGGRLVVDAPAALNLNGHPLPLLTLNAVATLVSDLRVTGLLDANAAIAGPYTTYVGGDALLATGFSASGTLESNGGTLTLEGPVSLRGFTVAGGASLMANAEGGVRTLTVTGPYLHQSGEMNLGSSNLVLDATRAGASPSFTFVDGTFSGAGAVVFNDNNDAAFIPVSTGGRDAAIPNVIVQRDGGIVEDANDGFSIVSGDGITVTRTLSLLGGAVKFNTDQAPALSLADGATVVRHRGVLLDVPTFGALVSNTYNQPVVTGPELARSGGSLTVNANVVLASGSNPTFQRVDLNAQVDASVQDASGLASLNVASGGTVEVGIPNPLTEPYSSGGPITLKYDAAIGAPGTTLREWPAGVAIAHLILSAPVDLGSDHTTQHLTVEAGADLDLAGSHTLTVTGDALFAAGSSLSNVRGTPGSTGVLEFAGDKPQSLTLPSTGLSPTTTASPTGVVISIDNDRGVRLVGGNLTMDARSEQMRFVTGAFDTAANGTVLTLFHENSDQQGFIQVNGGVVGDVRKEVVNNNIPGVPPIANRLEFPLCTAGCDAIRNMALSFNDPSQVGPGRTGVMVTARHQTTSPGGHAGLPVQTTDRDGNPLTITRYPDFHWQVSSNVVISLIDYDVTLRADGYEEFAAERIGRTTALRRESGANTPWTLLGNGPASYGNTQDGAGNPTVLARDNIGAFELAPGLLFTYGLESTITVLDPSPVHLSTGQSTQLTLDGGVFTGGNPGNAFNYTVDSTNPAVATAYESGGVLTITALAKGSAIINVTATDALGNLRTLGIRVNVDFVVGAVETVVQHVGGTATLDLLTVVQGGARPYTYVVSTVDPAVATAEITADILTVTAVGPGTTVVNVVVSDADGATVVVSVNVIATNAVIVASAIPDMELRVGQPAVTFDLNTVFSGATQNLVFRAGSANDAAVLAVVDQNELSLATLVGDPDGTPVTITVTAIDGLNNQATDSFQVIPLPLWGDGSVDGAVSEVDARLVLQDAVGQIRQQPGPLTDVQRTTLNVSGGSLTSFDAARILQRVVGIVDCFSVEPGCSTQLEDVGGGVLAFGEATTETGTSTLSVPVILTGTVEDVFGVQFQSQLDLTQVTFLSANYDLPYGWISEQSLTVDGLLKVAFAGPTPITQPGAYVTLKFESTTATSQPSFSADGFINEGPSQSLGTVTATASEERADLPTEFALKGNYPNPFNPTTTVQFDLPASAEVSLEVIDMLGRKVLSLAPRMLEAASDQTFSLDASRLTSGTYVYRVLMNGTDGMQVRTGMLTLLK